MPTSKITLTDNRQVSQRALASLQFISLPKNCINLTFISCDFPTHENHSIIEPIWLKHIFYLNRATRRQQQTVGLAKQERPNWRRKWRRCPKRSCSKSQDNPMRQHRYLHHRRLQAHKSMIPNRRKTKWKSKRRRLRLPLLPLQKLLRKQTKSDWPKKRLIKKEKRLRRKQRMSV